MKLTFLFSVELRHKDQKKCIFSLISSVFSAKTGICYPDFELDNKFWNWVQVPGSCYNSLTSAMNFSQHSFCLSALTMWNRTH